MKNKKVTITKNEMEIIEAIISSDHAGDRHGLAGYIGFQDWDDDGNQRDMKKLRGSMASLLKKGICEFDRDEEYDDHTWGIITEDFQEKANKNEPLPTINSKLNSLQKKSIEWNGYKLKNIALAN